MKARTREVGAFLLTRINKEWKAQRLKVVNNPEMGNSECVCLGYTCIPIRGMFRSPNILCVTNENGVPILVPGEEGDRVLFIPEYVELERIDGIELRKPFHTVMGYKIYNYKKVEQTEDVENVIS